MYQMPKYEREEATFKNLKEHYEQAEISANVWSQIFHGWETEELRRLLDMSVKNATAIISELDKLLDMIERRRTK